jgi:hypothetical protein
VGYDFIEIEGHFQMAHDMDIWTLRHFLMTEVKALSPDALSTDEATLAELRAFFDKWNWIGPGVWHGLDFRKFVQDRAERREALAVLFRRVAERISSFGSEIPLEYLQQHVNTPTELFTAPQATERFVRLVERLLELLTAAKGQA